MTHLIDLFKPMIPSLLNNLHKGQSGRIAIMGGSKEYTGAPFFSGISSLKIGSDICHIFAPTEGGTATALKTMSPDLIVHPIEKNDPSDIIPWLLSLHVIVVGPGLGRSSGAWSCASEVIKAARNINLPIVLDGDALRLICDNLDIIKGYDKAILTPNFVEFKSLSDSVKKMIGDTSNNLLKPEHIASCLGNITIVQKGKEDIITDGNQTVVCDDEGMPRRCGGQGDILAGTVGTMYAWSQLYYKYNSNTDDKPEYPISIISAYAACSLLRHCSKKAYQISKRSTVSMDIINQISNGFEDLFPESSK
ncbi:uncharacterized protein family, carbohydrate kinase-related [Dictyostelium discoideum AX4]|uniref:ATP-dependent (S)-NAD(P)H-hydrate dehydratase n=1 Tax=Dictyostelium discoideum TaxID=44689 RepID=NNRD_DICDI|nr:uncharacterized protein family, carbohydrate kinase-related [Dictyostelium discoideum AX4]Q54FJ9.1 RecName: Full=ATP-dependent (S)-NAD(P)H-hydrate dehydratase; AltName: Full=ATP-dependent NAD(P)HX dehydratase [Dictyostelium discoideum]EAL62033.1 uncharacterized protein family, carbohydrate kinase-related [Dictyostelium discoideum AX4]|eukprot:XP_635541.1 uncharacterized protein family, carbohydrate kinase-related [Dictyostelium discoideum AX4]